MTNPVFRLAIHLRYDLATMRNIPLWETMSTEEIAITNRWLDEFGVWVKNPNTELFIPDLYAVISELDAISDAVDTWRHWSTFSMILKRALIETEVGAFTS